MEYYALLGIYVKKQRNRMQKRKSYGRENDNKKRSERNIAWIAF